VELRQWTPAASAAPTAEGLEPEPQDDIPAAGDASRPISPESLDPQDAGRLDD
jgi:hypothetical protein